MNFTTPRPQESMPESPDWWLMARKFAKHGTAIATLVPSSPFLSRALCKGIDYDKAKCIVELGAGTGPVTKEILARIKPHTRLVIVEIDPDFCKRLRTRFPGADIVEGDAGHMDTLLAERGIKQVDHVISGLPLPSFSEELRTNILAASARSLAPEGTFRQLTLMPLVYWKLYRKYWNNVRFKFLPINLPPAGIYICRDFKEQPAQ